MVMGLAGSLGLLVLGENIFRCCDPVGEMAIMGVSG